MKLTFLGTGGAFVNGNNYHSNMVLTSDSGKNLLIDCGSDAKRSLAAAGFKPEDIDAVYVSHMHRGHADLEWLGFYTYFVPSCTKRPTLFLHESLVGPLWDALAPSMARLNGLAATLSTYFDVQPVRGNLNFKWEISSCSLIPNIHVENYLGNMVSHGLSIRVNSDDNWPSMYISTDTKNKKYASQLGICDHYDSMPLIFHDVDLMNITDVHVHYNELKKLPEVVKANTWLYHYNDERGEYIDCKADGFAGYVRRGQVFEF